MEQKKLHYIEKIIIFTLIGLICYFAFINTNNFFLSLQERVNDISSILIFILYFIFNIFYVIFSFAFYSMLTFSFALFITFFFSYRIYTINKLKKAEKIAGVKYEDISYYRDIFSVISPSFVSLIEDYNIDLYRDLCAVTLKLVKDGYLSINDSTVIVLDKDKSSLRDSEKMVIDLYLGNGKENFFVSKGVFSEYENTVIKEAINEGYIVNRSDDVHNKDYKWIIPLIVITLVLVYFKLAFIILVPFVPFIFIFKNSKKMYKYLQYQIFTLFICGFLARFFPMLTLLMLAIAVVVFPITMVSLLMGSVFSYIDKRLNFKRTDKGNKLHYNIMGLKRFMKDFSNLEDRSGKEVVLWDYYLTYSIVLNINKKAYDDMSAILMKYLTYPNGI